MPFKLTHFSILKKNQRILKRIDQLIAQGKKVVYLPMDAYMSLIEKRGDLTPNNAFPSFVTYRGIRIFPMPQKS